MQQSQWLAGAFSAYGLIDVIGRARPKISLFTTSEHQEYVRKFAEYCGFGTTKPFKGRWHWSCDEPARVQQFYVAVGPHLIEAKRSMIEGAWEEWRRQMLDRSDGERDPGPIDTPVLYPALHTDDA